MRFWLALLVCSTCLIAQDDDPEVARAKAGIEKLRELVAAGAAPRQQLERAEDQIADAQDASLLRKTLYGQDLTAEQTDEMLAAANRRLERRQKAYDEALKLVQAGVASQLSLTNFLEEKDLARKEVDLAESRARLIAQLAEMAKAEESLAGKSVHESVEEHELSDRFDGSGTFTAIDFSKAEVAFAEKFGKPLPVSAMGETAVHRSLGFDHRGRVDVAINPDTAEGIWLREYLVQHQIPYFAFRQAVPGKATGAHIHMGPMSTRLKMGG